jgi:hypothetical protein
VNAGPPAFLRRNLATHATDDSLVALACDENLWVRRDAVRNPATPSWVLDLLARAGADAQLRGRTAADPTMPPDDLRRLVECGPWARLLVADHPNTSADVLDVLARQPDHRLRAAAARHANTVPSTVAHLCADADPSIRSIAATNLNRPDEVVDLLRRAGASDDLDWVRQDPADRLQPDEAALLAELGPWGRFLAARHTSCPAPIVREVATDPDWRVRSALLDNESVSDELLELATETPPPHDDLRHLARPEPDPSALASAVEHVQPAVRLAVARHPATPSDTLGHLATDRSADIRRTAATHPNLEPDMLAVLVRAGSSPDLARLADSDPTIEPEALEQLARSGYWARQLVVRHPSTAPTTLARLLCDDDPKLREWAAAHPAMPTDVVTDIRRAGGASDFQGVTEGDPDAPAELLRRVARLGPWGAGSSRGTRTHRRTSPGDQESSSARSRRAAPSEVR